MLPRTLTLTIEIPNPAHLIEYDHGTAPYYLASVRINGADHHLCIFPVVEEEEGDAFLTQDAAQGHDQWYQAMQDVDGGGNRYETVDIEGQPFVCLMTPYCT